MSALLKADVSAAPAHETPQLGLRTRHDDDRLSPAEQADPATTNDMTLGIMFVCCALFAAACILYGYYPAIQSLIAK